MTQHRNAKRSDGGKLSMVSSQCEHHAASVASVGAHPSSQPEWYSTLASSPPSTPHALHVSTPRAFLAGEARLASPPMPKRSLWGLRSGERGGHCSRVIYSGTLARNQSCVNSASVLRIAVLDIGPVSATEPISRCWQHSGFKDRKVERCSKILRKKE